MGEQSAGNRNLKQPHSSSFASHQREPPDQFGEVLRFLGFALPHDERVPAEFVQEAAHDEFGVVSFTRMRLMFHERRVLVKRSLFTILSLPYPFQCFYHAHAPVYPPRPDQTDARFKEAWDTNY